MLPESALRAKLQSIPSIPAHGPFSRCVGLHHLLPKGKLLPAAPPQPLWGMGSKVAGGRYTPRGLFETIYLAEDTVTALTEVTAVVMTGSGVTTLATNPWALVSVRGVLLSVLNLVDAAIVVQMGTTAQELSGEWRYTQAMGGEAPTQLLGRVSFDSGRFDGIRYPSSKNPPNGCCVAVFPDRLKNPAFLEVYDSYGNLAQRLP
jgi:RES domain-containing protein